MTMQYEQQNINLDPETGFKSYFFDPNGTQSDTTFTDWDAMLNVLRGLPGTKQILIPEALPVITIPSGTYDMTDIIISGVTPFSSVEINDVVFQNLQQINSLSVAVGVAAVNSVSSFQYNNGSANGITFDKVSFVVGALAVVPIFDVTAGTTLSISAHESAFLSLNAGVPVFAVDATSGLLSQASAGVQGNNWGGGPGSSAFVVVAPGGIFTLEITTGDIFFASNNPSGPTTLTRSPDFEVSTPADWVGSPTDYNDAVNRIASVVAGAHGAIP